jgi:hypothetical protein
MKIHLRSVLTCSKLQGKTGFASVVEGLPRVVVGVSGQLRGFIRLPTTVRTVISCHVVINIAWVQHSPFLAAVGHSTFCRLGKD